MYYESNVKKVRVQVIKVYDVDIPPKKDPIDYVYNLQTTFIEQEGNLVDTMLDYAEVIE